MIITNIVTPPDVHFIWEVPLPFFPTQVTADFRDYAGGVYDNPWCSDLPDKVQIEQNRSEQSKIEPDRVLANTYYLTVKRCPYPGTRYCSRCPGASMCFSRKGPSFARRP